MAAWLSADSFLTLAWLGLVLAEDLTPSAPEVPERWGSAEALPSTARPSGARSVLVVPCMDNDDGGGVGVLAPSGPPRAGVTRAPVDGLAADADADADADEGGIKDEEGLRRCPEECSEDASPVERFEIASALANVTSRLYFSANTL